MTASVYDSLGDQVDISVTCDRIIKNVMKLKEKKYNTLPDLDMNENEIRQILAAGREAFMREETLVEADAPVNICGNIQGQFGDLLRMLDFVGWPPDNKYLFLGDYVDRGRQSIEVYTVLLTIKLRYPDCITMLRGNHESHLLNHVYGFYDEVKRRYSLSLYKAFQDCFNVMPWAAVVEGKIFCIHGGLGPTLESFDQIKAAQRPAEVPEDGPLCDLVWADPGDVEEGLFRVNGPRRISYVFSRDAVEQACQKLEVELICRAHQVVEDGYEFFADRKCVTLFSAPNYCGKFDNAAACMTVDENLHCSIMILRPVPAKRQRGKSR